MFQKYRHAFKRFSKTLTLFLAALLIMNPLFLTSASAAGVGDGVVGFSDWQGHWAGSQFGSNELGPNEEGHLPVIAPTLPPAHEPAVLIVFVEMEPASLHGLAVTKGTYGDEVRARLPHTVTVIGEIEGERRAAEAQLMWVSIIYNKDGVGEYQADALAVLPRGRFFPDNWEDDWEYYPLALAVTIRVIEPADVQVVEKTAGRSVLSLILPMPVPGLEDHHVKIVDNLGMEVEVVNVNSDDGGLTYGLQAELSEAEAYSVVAGKPGCLPRSLPFAVRP